MVETDTENSNGVRKHVYFPFETWTNLEGYLTEKFGRSDRGLSLTVDQAVREFLKRENGRGFFSRLARRWLP